MVDLVGRRPQPHAHDAPGRRRFTNGVGTLLATDPDNKKSMARFTWSHITPVSAVWDQATSENAGATWVTSWYMDFKRV